MINNINDFKKFCTLVVKIYIYIYIHTHAHTRTSLLKGKRCKRYSTRRQLYIGYSNTRMEKDCMNYTCNIITHNPNTGTGL